MDVEDKGGQGRASDTQPPMNTTLVGPMMVTAWQSARFRYMLSSRMKKPTPPEIKTPCSKLWQEMPGDAQVRFCDHCQLHVQNLSTLSQRDIARTLARSKTEHVCVTYIRRGDGSMVTRWGTICDSLFGPLRRGFTWALAACAPIVLSACQTQSQLTGRVLPKCSTPQKKAAVETNVERVIVTGGVYVSH